MGRHVRVRMRDTVFRWIAGILSIMLLALPALLPPPTVEDGGTEQAMLPPCDVEEGIPFIQEEQVTCYWGMSEEILSLPKAIDALNVDVSVSWAQSGVWIGIAEASEAEKCVLKESYYECEKESITLVAGNQASGNSIDWQATSGEYRFVAGGDDTQTLQQFDVVWKYEATLAVSPTAYIVFAVLLGAYAAIGINGIKNFSKKLLPKA